MPALREAAFARFAELGLPTTESEDWKYTSLAALAEMDFVPRRRRPTLQRSSCRDSGLLPSTAPSRSYSSTAITGRSFLRLPGAPVDRSSAACERRSRITAIWWHASWPAMPISAGRAHRAQHGLHRGRAFIHLPAGAAPQSPIHLLFLSTASRGATLSHPRNLIVAGGEARRRWSRPTRVPRGDLFHQCGDRGGPG